MEKKQNKKHGKRYHQTRAHRSSKTSQREFPERKETPTTGRNVIMSELRGGKCDAPRHHHINDETTTNRKRGSWVLRPSCSIRGGQKRLPFRSTLPFNCQKNDEKEDGPKKNKEVEGQLATVGDSHGLNAVVSGSAWHDKNNNNQTKNH